MSDTRDAIERGLRLTLALDEDEYTRVADRISEEMARSSDGEAIREALGNCPSRFVAIFAALRGDEWGRLLRVAYALAGGRFTCQCHYCRRG